jgi:4'-phosphopantetheinyl transferase
MLTRDEATRADGFVHRDDQVRALVGRGVLRLLLGRAMRRSGPLMEPLDAGPAGKPALPGGPAFNVSHGGGVVLLGFSTGHAVGVDVEPVASGGAWREVMSRLHPIERAELTAARDPPAAFLRIWTRKEAVAKAAGAGLSVDSRDWAVGTGIGVGWRVFDLEPEMGHAGAIAVGCDGHARQDWAPRCWTFHASGADFG